MLHGGKCRLEDIAREGVLRLHDHRLPPPALRIAARFAGRVLPIVGCERRCPAGAGVAQSGWVIILSTLPRVLNQTSYSSADPTMSTDQWMK